MNYSHGPVEIFYQAGRNLFFSFFWVLNQEETTE